jgi:hypothetical protein
MKLLATILLLFWGLLAQAKSFSDTLLIRRHLIQLTQTPGFRNYQNQKILNQAAAYIKTEFEKYSQKVSVQEYETEGQTYRNIICSFGPENAPRIIVGAHYDVCGNQQGADDNATGTTGLLELARLLQHADLNVRIDLVAYTLEEPPFFRTKHMGSYVHAKSLADAKVPVLGMVSLEMIGYFKDEKGTQDYPTSVLKPIYGSRGNYITLVRKFGAGKFACRFNRAFHQTDVIRTKSFVGPAALPGIDFSDHLNYWAFDFSALMVTDTAFYRNKNYHEPTDTIEKIDLFRMAKVIDGVYLSLQKLSKLYS